MLNLIKREWMLSGRLLILTYLGYGMIAVFVFSIKIMEKSLVAPFVLMAIMFSFVPIVIVAREDKFKAAAWTCSLPVTRKQIVGARYLLSALLGVGGLILLILLRLALDLLGGRAETSLTFPTLFIATGVTAMVISLVLPFLLRYGVMSVLMLGAGLQVLGILLFLLVQVLDLRRPFQALIGQIAWLVVESYERFGTAGACTMIGLLLTLVAASSYLLASRLYERKDF